MVIPFKRKAPIALGRPRISVALAPGTLLAGEDPQDTIDRSLPSNLFPHYVPIELRAAHECCHAARAVQRGGVVEKITLDDCEVSGLRGIEDHLQYRVAGPCADFMFGYRRELSPDRSVFLEALDAVRREEIDPAHDLHNVFHILKQLRPSSNDDELISIAELKIAECHQALRQPDWFLPIQKVANALAVAKRLSGDEFCHLLMEDD